MAEEVEEEGDKIGFSSFKEGSFYCVRRRSSVVKKKTPTRTRRTIARLRTPITHKTSYYKRTTSTRTRRKITSTAEKQGEEL